jgi:hypothetical protein
MGYQHYKERLMLSINNVIRERNSRIVSRNQEETGFAAEGKSKSEGSHVADHE